jgi:hypothetical protein
VKRTHFWSCGQEATGYAPTWRQGAGRDPGVGSLSPFAAAAGGLAAHRAQKTPVDVLATNVEIDLLVLPGRVITLDLASVLGSGALWSVPSEPRGHRLSAPRSAFDRVREADGVRKHDLVAAGHLH